MSTIRVGRSRVVVLAIYAFYAAALAAPRSLAQTTPIPLLSPLPLPATLTGNKIDLSFMGDPGSGVRFTTLTHHQGGNFAFINNPGRVGLDWRLWEIRGTRSSPPSSYTVSPLNVTGPAAFSAYNSTGAGGVPAFAFVWDPVVIDPGNALRVVIQVALGTNDQVSRWRCEVTRVQPPGAPSFPPPTASLDEVDLPIVYFNVPIVQRSGESLNDAQIRARLLIPQDSLLSKFSAHGLDSSNVPLKNFLMKGLPGNTDLLASHPNGPPEPLLSQSLQFAALYLADDQMTTGFRKMLYMGTEDTTGYAKRFRYIGVNFPSGGASLHQFGWRATSFPPYATITGVPSVFANAFASPYPIVLGALRAQDNAFWFDACEYYRGFVEASGMAGPKLDVNPNIGKSKGPVVFGFHLQFAVPPVKSGQTMYQRFLDITNAWIAAMKNNYTNSGDAYMHWQNYLTGGAGTQNPNYPVANDIDSGVSTVLASARALGIRTEPYTRPVELFKNSAWFGPPPPGPYPPQVEAYDRAGQPAGGANSAATDFGATLAHTWSADNIVDPLISTVGFSSVYLDVFGGSGAELTYDNPVSGPQHVAHGGDYFERGKVAYLDHVRSVLRTKSPFGNPDPHVIISTEVAEEYLTSRLDFAGQGYDWVPGHLLLAEDTRAGYGPSGAPPITTDWSAPLWNAVYHEWLPSTPILVPFSSLGLATNPTFSSLGTNVGMTAAEWTDLFCYCQSCAFAAGSRATLLNDVIDYDWPMVSLNGTQVVVNTSVDPSATGLTIMGLMKTLYKSLAPSFAGPFVLTGRMLRPINVDYASTEVDKAPNPTQPCATKFYLPHSEYYFPLIENPFFYDHASNAHGSFDVPKVLSSVWRSSAGATAIVIVNWTGGSASWAGTFDPTLYGMGSGSHSLVEISVTGASVTWGSATGTFTLHVNSGTPSPNNIYVAPIAQRSVRIFLVQ